MGTSNTDICLSDTRKLNRYSLSPSPTTLYSVASIFILRVLGFYVYSWQFTLTTVVSRPVTVTKTILTLTCWCTNVKLFVGYKTQNFYFHQIWQCSKCAEWYSVIMVFFWFCYPCTLIATFKWVYKLCYLIYINQLCVTQPARLLLSCVPSLCQVVRLWIIQDDWIQNCGFYQKCF